MGGMGGGYYGGHMEVIGGAGMNHGGAFYGGNRGMGGGSFGNHSRPSIGNVNASPFRGGGGMGMVHNSNFGGAGMGHRSSIGGAGMNRAFSHQNFANAGHSGAGNGIGFASHNTFSHGGFPGVGNHMGNSGFNNGFAGNGHNFASTGLRSNLLQSRLASGMGYYGNHGGKWGYGGNRYGLGGYGGYGGWGRYGNWYRGGWARAYYWMRLFLPLRIGIWFRVLWLSLVGDWASGFELLGLRFWVLGIQQPLLPRRIRWLRRIWWRVLSSCLLQLLPATHCLHLRRPVGE